MNIKVLALEYWMTDEDWLHRVLDCDRYRPVDPKVHCAGVYLCGEECWFETPSGLAFTYPKQDFEFKLRMLNAERITERQANALSELIIQRLATPAQKRLLGDYQTAMRLRSTFRSAMKNRISVLGSPRISTNRPKQ